MPFIKRRTNRVKSVRHICRLQEPNRDALVLYARFIGDTPDYVPNALIDATPQRTATSSRGVPSIQPCQRCSGLQPSVMAHGRCGRRTESGEGRVRTLIEYRVVVSLACSSLVGTVGLQVWSFSAHDVLLGLIALQRPHLY